MKPLTTSAAVALALVVSTSAVALQPSRSDTRARTAGTVINTILNRDSALDRQYGDTSKEQAKRDRERAKGLRKQEHERRKAIREDNREREKDRREAARERAKDARERNRDRRN